MEIHFLLLREYNPAVLFVYVPRIEIASGLPGYQPDRAIPLAYRAIAAKHLTDAAQHLGGKFSRTQFIHVSDFGFNHFGIRPTLQTVVITLLRFCTIFNYLPIKTTRN